MHASRPQTVTVPAARPDLTPQFTEPDLGSLGAPEELDVDPFTGALTYQLPLRIPKGRDGFSPDLSLTYNSSHRNSPFGWGWQLRVPVISRRVWPTLSRYADDSDVFELNGDELVPALRVSGGWIDDRFTVGEFTVQRFRRRYENSHHRIERWTHQPSNQTHWRVIDANNVTSQFGTNEESRVSDPNDPTRVLQWLLAEQFDDRGNIIRYSYKRETLESTDGTPNATKYLKRVQYGNLQPHDRSHWLFEVVFDYGDHDEDDPSPHETREWALRSDTYSSNRGAFPLRWLRRCRRALVFHNFPELAADPVLVSSTDFVYDEQTGRSLLTSYTVSGFVSRPGSVPARRSLPSIEFHYQNPDLDDSVRELDAPVVVAALAGGNQDATWVDLHGEALPGLLLWRGDEWHYIRNLGGGDFAEAVAVEEAVIADEVTREDLIDRNGVEAPPIPPTAPGEEDLHVGYIDLNDDGSDDVVVAGNNIIRWYPSDGDVGFADPFVLKLSSAPVMLPHVLAEFDNQVFFVADMNGDGLYDLVRVRANDVTYWPHLGNGRYGEAVSMRGRLDIPVAEVTKNSVFLADLTTTGSSDLVWVGNGEIRYWENLDGSRYGAMHRIHAPGLDPHHSHVAVTDLFGRAADCIVWLDESGPGRVLRYVAPIGDRRPDLLSGVDNGRGLEARVAYVTTSELRRRDRLQGMDQLATLPRSVQVVERIERRDYLAQTRQFRRFVFRHGAYDTERQQFIGFGLQEEYSSTDGDDYDTPGLFQHETMLEVMPEQRTPPSVIRRWFHTGLMFEGEDLTAELSMEWFVDPVTHRHTWLSGHRMPTVQDGFDITHAHKALTGRILREEHYAGHHALNESTPHKVREFTSRISQVQPAQSAPAAFAAARAEEVTVLHAADVNDPPRIEHVAVLGVDDFGNEITRATVHYGLHDAEEELQRETFVQYEELTFANRNDQATWYRVGVPVERITWRLVGLEAPEKGVFSAADIQHLFDNVSETAPGTHTHGPHKSVQSHIRYRYWANDLTHELEIGRVESRALQARVERLALSDELAQSAYSEVMDEQELEAVLREAGYESEGNNWWFMGDTVTYDPARFYLPCAWTNAAGQELTATYNSTSLCIESLNDAYGNATRCEFHPRALAPWKYTDPNGNVVAMRFDALSLPLSCAVIGKPDQPQGDVLALDRLEASSADDPTHVITYDAHAYAERGEPVWIRCRRRDRHRDPETTLFDRISFYDGCGRLLAVSEKAGNQWRVVELYMRDAEGNVVRSGAPVFSEHPLPDTETRRRSFERGHSFKYDIEGRLIRVDEPGGLIRTFEFHPWKQLVSDPNDNIMESGWYAQRAGSTQARAGDFAALTSRQYESRAAALAATHAQTPTTELLNAQGKVTAVTSMLSTSASITERLVRDANGNVIEVIDGRNRPALTETIDLLGRSLRATSIDAGTSVFVYGPAAEITRRFTADGTQLRYLYDKAGHLTHVYAINGDEKTLVERTVWGGGEVTISEVAERNLIGVPHIRLNGLGLESIEVCDWNGNAVRTSYQLANERTPTPDWSVVADVVHAGQVAAFLSSDEVPAIDANVRSVDAIADAAGRPVMQSVLDAITLFYEYDEARHVTSIRARVEGVSGERVLIENVQYDAANRLAAITYGDGTVVRREFNDSGLVERVRATGEAPFDHAVVRDPNGNIMNITHNGELTASFVYDGRNRVIKAEGIDGGERFAHSYAYDDAGNVSELVSKSGGNETTQTFTYAGGSNRLTRVGDSSSGEFFSDDDASYSYDAAGNMTNAHHQTLTWDAYGRLVKAEDEDQSTLFGYGSAPGVMRRVINHAGAVGVGDQSLLAGDVAATSDGSHVVVRVRIDGIAIANVERTLDTSGGVQATIQYLYFDENENIVPPGNNSSVISAPLGFIQPGDGYQQPLWNDFSATLSVRPVNGRWHAPWLGRFIDTNSNAPNPYAV